MSGYSRFDVQGLIDLIAELGGRYASLHYSGYGDEGSFSKVLVKSSDGAEIILSKETLGALTSFGYSILSELWAGWETDIGSFGVIYIDVSDQEISIHHDDQYEVEDNYDDVFTRRYWTVIRPTSTEQSNSSGP